jgi:DNA/RNA endonuclease G (NUC1)
VDYVELELRRRTFWVAYSLDKYLAAALGRPRTFKDEDIDQVSRSQDIRITTTDMVTSGASNSR